MTVFRIVLPVVLVPFLIFGEMCGGFFPMCQNKEKMEKGEEKNSSRIGFISDKLYFYEV